MAVDKAAKGTKKRLVGVFKVLETSGDSFDNCQKPLTGAGEFLVNTVRVFP